MKNRPRRALFLIVVVLLLSSLWTAGLPSAATGALSAEPSSPVVVRLYFEDRDHLNAVAGQLDVWEVQPTKGFAVALVQPAEFHRLQELGYRVEVDTEKTEKLLAPQAALDPRFYYFDSFYANANGRYVVDFLQDINTNYPGLTELYNIGDAWLAGQTGEHDRNIWVLRISNEDPAYGDIADKPAFFLFANIHAREVATPELAMRYIRYLTEGYNGEGGYGTDADVTWLVNHNVAYVLVMQNPDGHWQNEQSTGNYRRKNMDNDDGCSTPGSWGVDLNRNSSFKWGCCGGSDSAPCGETYRGPSRGSEPETQAFETFFASVMLDQNGPNGDDEIPPAAPDDTTGIFITLHSYSDLVLWPWGFQDFGNSPNYDQMRTIGRKFSTYNGYDASGSIWYDVDGATDDWTYGKFGIPSYTFEVGSGSGACGGFFPAYGCVDGIDGMSRNFWAENKPTFLYAHKIARTPYMTAYGPDAENLAAVPGVVSPGDALDLTATIQDQRCCGDTPQPIASAEYFVDAPGADGAGTPMSPLDGSWGGLSEQVTATLDSTGLSQGQHYLLVHGQNDGGDWGPFSAIFLYVLEPGVAPVIEGTVREQGSNDPLAATVTANTFQTQTDPTTGYYSMTVISDTYELSAVATDHAAVTVSGVQAQNYQTVQQDFSLPVVCEVFKDEVEGGDGNWSHQADQGDDLWTLSTAQSHSPGHAWFVPDDSSLTDSYLWNTTPIPVEAGSKLTFWHRYQFEGSSWDGAVLEISANGGAWTDLGPHIATNGYNGTLSSSYGNPLGGRNAWTGDRTTWTQVEVDLDSFAGQSVQIRWRLGCDSSTSDVGWYIDDVALTSSGAACNPGEWFHLYLPLVSKNN